MVKHGETSTLKRWAANQSSVSSVRSADVYGVCNLWDMETGTMQQVGTLSRAVVEDRCLKMVEVHSIEHG